MTLSSTPCSCDGLNENCFRCWGTGMVEPKATPAPVPKLSCPTPYELRVDYVPTRSKRSKARAKTQKPIAQCPHCGVDVRKLEKHLLKVHRIVQFANNTVRGSMAASKGPLQAKLRCESCGLHFSNATQLASHVIGSHGKRVFKKLGYRGDYQSGVINTLPENEARAITGFCRSKHKRQSLRCSISANN